jgi:hypothetical protein
MLQQTESGVTANQKMPCRFKKCICKNLHSRQLNVLHSQHCRRIIECRMTLHRGDGWWFDYGLLTIAPSSQVMGAAFAILLVFRSGGGNAVAD